MSDESSQFEAAPQHGRRTLVVTMAVVLAIIAVIVAFFIFWPKISTKNQTVAPAQTPAATSVPTIDSTPGVPNVYPGLDRPLTTEEKQHYGFVITDDIWLRTTNPTDGSKPVMSFYNKTKPKYMTPPVPVLLNPKDND